MHALDKIYYTYNGLPSPSMYQEGDLMVDVPNMAIYVRFGGIWTVLGTDPTVTNFDVYDDLRSASTPNSPIILVGGRDSVGDGGSGFFIRDPLNRADNDGTVLVDGDGVSWLRVFNGRPMAVWFTGSGTFTIDMAIINRVHQAVWDYHQTNEVDWSDVTFTRSLPFPGAYTFDYVNGYRIFNMSIDNNGAQISLISNPDIEVYFEGLTISGRVLFSGDGSYPMRVSGSTIIATNTTLRGYVAFHNNLFIDRTQLGDFFAEDYAFVYGNVFVGPRINIRGDATFSSNLVQRFNIPDAGSNTASITDRAVVVGNRFYSYVDGTNASGSVLIENAERVMFANNFVFLHRHIYPYVFTIREPQKLSVLNNVFYAHSSAGQDLTEWRYNVDAQLVEVIGNTFIAQGTSGNYGVRILGADGAMANTLISGNQFVNEGAQSGAGIERRNGVGNIKIIGNAFFNWSSGLRKYDAVTTIGTVDGNSNVFSGVNVAINDPDYVNSTADTNWG